MTKFQISTKDDIEKSKETHPDSRTWVEKMFFDHDKVSGEKIPLTITPVKEGSDWKRYSDCIPLIENYAGDDDAYTGVLKGRTLLVFGGRRKGRAGTGVELALPVEDIVPFSDLLKEVAGLVQKEG
jgi:hypothetical protein